MIDKKVTVSQIAKYAGVSPATVSRVLNHRDQVKEDTILKVEEAMNALNFTPSYANTNLLINVNSLTNPFYGEVLQGVLASAKAADFCPLIYQEHLSASTISNFCQLIKNVNAAGVLLLNQTPLPLLDAIHAFVPVVQCCDYDPDSSISYIGINDFSSARNAVRHLIASGRKKIAFLNGPKRFVYAQERQRGYEKALEESGISLPSGWHINLPKVDYDIAYSNACQLLNNENHPNAFFTSSDILAAAVIRAAKRFGLQVPQDVMVVGFDNRDISQMMIPSITTVNQPKFQLGYGSCDILINQIRNPGIVTDDSMLLDTELIVREIKTFQKSFFLFYVSYLFVVLQISPLHWTCCQHAEQSQYTFFILRRSWLPVFTAFFQDLIDLFRCFLLTGYTDDV